jgi:hypothetical protein
MSMIHILKFILMMSLLKNLAAEKYGNIKKDKLKYYLLGIGGSGPTKRIPAKNIY